MIFLMILNLSGNSPMTGLTFRATGLYFLLVARFMCWVSESVGVDCS